MSSFVEIAGKKLHSVSSAAELTGYSRDYIARLAREQKITGAQVGRQWFVSLASLQRYTADIELVKDSRKQQLRDERKRERSQALVKLQKQRVRELWSFPQSVVPTLAASAVLFGIGLGVWFQSAVFHTADTKPQVASVAISGDDSPTFLVEESSVTGMQFSPDGLTVSTMAGQGQGVMLLPRQADAELTQHEVAAMFSDPVTIATDVHGTQHVVRKKADGTEETLPFVVVPVSSNQNQP